jgi:hypothetical protein
VNGFSQRYRAEFTCLCWRFGSSPRLLSAIDLIYKVILFELHRATAKAFDQGPLGVARRDVEKLFKNLEKLVAEDIEAYKKFAQPYQDKERKNIKQHFSKIIDVSRQVLEKPHAGRNVSWILSLKDK